jgi:hypothetical protein
LPVCPTATDCELGVIAIDIKDSVDEPVTVKVAFAVTAVPSGLVQIAVTDVVPALTAVASPVLAPIVAIAELVTLQATWLVRSTDSPAPVVPIAINCAVWPIGPTVLLLGVMVNAFTGSVVVVVDWATLTVALPEIKPLNPGALAVTGIFVHVLLPEVMSPVALTVTQSGVELFQVT